MHLPKFRAWKLAETQAQESLALWSDAHAKGQQSSKRLLEAILKQQRVVSHRLFAEAMAEMEAASDSLDRSGAGPGLAWPGLAALVGRCLNLSIAARLQVTLPT